jgi:hypothetical protein
MVPIFECVLQSAAFSGGSRYVPETSTGQCLCVQPENWLRLRYIPIPCKRIQALGLKDAVYVTNGNSCASGAETPWPSTPAFRFRLPERRLEELRYADPEEDFRYAGLRDVMKLSRSPVGVVGMSEVLTRRLELFGMENFAY